MSRAFVADKKRLIKNLVIIDGHVRTGKFFMGNVLDGFEKIDHYQCVGVLEQVPHLEYLGFIPRQTAKFLIQTTIDTYGYNMRVGRDLNFRKGDKSSLVGSFEEKRYVKRMNEEKGYKQVLRDIASDGRYSVFILHEIMMNIKLLFEAFPQLKVLRMNRHPVDVIHSWYKKGWCKREATDPFSFGPCITAKDGDIAWYAHPWREKYNVLSHMDRVIECLNYLSRSAKKGYASLESKYQKRINVISYENLVEEPQKVLKSIGKFLKIDPSKHMSKILEKEHCPGKISLDAREDKKKFIEKKASRAGFETLLRLSKEYEDNYQLLNWLQ